MRNVFWMILILGSFSLAHAEEESDYLLQDEGSQTTMEFDDGLIEGIDLTNPDFGTITTRSRDVKKNRLYRKMMTFDREMKESYREFRYTQ